MRKKNIYFDEVRSLGVIIAFALEEDSSAEGIDGRKKFERDDSQCPKPCETQVFADIDHI
ncbi:hypothetical protein [Scytonema hofmannii]|uniref:hypothetical protein n=1 Tax=Scytonema hofmannii TaxID=34078 RepID=UPI00034A07F2|nr:hypothetical protein [Scytonema hofmannii]